MAGIYTVDNLGKRRIVVKKGMLRKETIERDFHIYEEVPESATLHGESVYRAHLSKRLKSGVRIYNATDNTHTRNDAWA